MSKKQVWVSPNSKDGGWRVHSAGAKRDTIHTLTKSEAVKEARKIAENQRAELLVQKADGKIGQSNSYGRDPFPPRG